MANGIFRIPTPKNEPVLAYGPGSKEKEELKAKLAEMGSRQVEIPVIIGGKEVKTGNLADCRCPHDHRHLLGRYHKVSQKEVDMAIEAALKARPAWAAMAWEDRAAKNERPAAGGSPGCPGAAPTPTPGNSQPQTADRPDDL